MPAARIDDGERAIPALRSAHDLEHEAVERVKRVVDRNRRRVGIVTAGTSTRTLTAWSVYKRKCAAAGPGHGSDSRRSDEGVFP